MVSLSLPAVAAVIGKTDVFEYPEIESINTKLFASAAEVPDVTTYDTITILPSVNLLPMTPSPK